MSHVIKIAFRPTSLDVLDTAAGRLGMELVRGQKTHRWYGRWANDYSDPERAAYLNGRDPKTFGKCDHAIRIKGAHKATYEIGVIQAPDGSFDLVYDAWGGSLERQAGKDLCWLKGEYGLEVASLQLQSEGWWVQRQVDEETGKPFLDVLEYT